MDNSQDSWQGQCAWLGCNVAKAHAHQPCFSLLPANVWYCIPQGTIYDYFVNFKTSKFTPWTDLVTDIEYDSAMPMSSLFVPTAETSSLRFFLDLMVTLKKPIMFVGGAGVGEYSLATVLPLPASVPAPLAGRPCNC